MAAYLVSQQTEEGYLGTYAAPRRFMVPQPPKAGSAPGVGSGLGLVICSLLVRALGGEISMQSHPGEGTQMTFTVRAQTPTRPRLADRGATNAASPVAVPAEQRTHLSVLVVEDNDVNRELLGIMLGQLGHRVTSAADGEQAVVLCGSQQFDVVLMDLNLPKIGGIEATRRIRAEERAAGQLPLRIVALTANAVANATPGPRPPANMIALHAWSLVHGLAMLVLDRRIEWDEAMVEQVVGMTFGGVD